MRKILFVVGCLFTVSLLQAQYNTLVFKPATFTAEDEITFTINVSGSGVDGESELYIWTWCNKDAGDAYPGKDGSTNTDWGNAPAAAKMTNKGGNVFEFKLTGTVMYGLDPGKLKHFQFLIKNKNGSKKTADDSPKYAFDPIVFVPAAYRVFPGKVGAGDMANLYFHQDLATSVDEQRMTPKTVTVALYDQSDAMVGQPKTWNLVSEGNKLFSYSFIPNFSWTLPAGTVLKKFTYRFDGTGTDAQGKPIAVTGTTNEKPIDALK